MDREIAKALKRHPVAILPWKDGDDGGFCARGIEPPYRRRVRAEHSAAVLKEQRKMKKRARRGIRTDADVEEAIFKVSRQSSRRSCRQAENMAKYDAISGYRPPSSFLDVLNAVFSSIVVEA